MQYLHQITTGINQSIQTILNDSRFEGSLYFGIATLAVDGDNLRPLLTNHHDDDKFISPDDDIPLQIYHRTLSISHTDDTAKSVGDQQRRKKETASMCLIAIGTRKLIRLTPEELESAIISGMPTIIDDATRKRLKLKSCMVKPSNSILDPVTVYQDENKTNTFDLRPNALMIRINYSIESTYDNLCFNICDC